jgi:hypothetical protein
MDEFGEYYKASDKRWDKNKEARDSRRDGLPDKEEEQRMLLFGKRLLKFEQSIQASSLTELRSFFKDFDGSKLAKVEVSARNSTFSFLCTEHFSVPGTLLGE